MLDRIDEVILLLRIERTLDTFTENLFFGDETPTRLLVQDTSKELKNLFLLFLQSRSSKSNRVTS